MAEAKVKVRLDTRQAKGDLRGLTRTAAAAGGRIGQGIRGAIGKGVGAIGLGAGIAAGVSAVRASTSSGIGDIIGESLGGIGAQINEFFLGDMDDKVRATKSAREETIQAYGAIAGRTGSIPPGARQYFEQIKSFREDEEKGRSLFENPKNGFRAETGIGDMIDRITKVLSDELGKAVTRLGEILNPFDGK